MTDHLTLAAWADAARPVLLEAASRYRALVPYRRLADAVQESSGLTTTAPLPRWMGEVLTRVSAECEQRGEPLLSSLCVNVQGSVGAAYADAVEQARGERPEDPDDHAAHERLACYRHWEAEGLPSDGGTPLRTAHVTPVRKAAPRRTTAKRAPAARTTTAAKPRTAAKPEPAPVALCPRCFTQLPATGVCDYCD